MLRVGLAGLGKMGILHAAILNTIKGVEVVAITEKETSLSKYIKDALPGAGLFQDYTDMIDSEKLDMMYITTPVSLHLSMIISCIEKNIGFFVEKPLNSNVQESSQIVSKLKTHDVFNAVGYNMRFVDTFAKTKSILQQGILGKISSVESSMYIANVFSKSNGWRFKKGDGRGVLLDFGCHTIDLLSWYFGAVDRVTGSTKTVYSEVEDFASAKLEFENEITAKFDTSWSKQGYTVPETDIKIYGDNGTLRVNQDFIEICLENKVPMFEKRHVKIFKQSLDTGIHFDVGGPEYTKENVDVIQSCTAGREPRVNVSEAFKTQCIIEAIYESAQSNAVSEVEYGQV